MSRNKSPFMSHTHEPPYPSTSGAWGVQPQLCSALCKPPG